MTLIQRTPLVNNLIQATNNINDDPENHKKKALVSGAAAIGLGVYGLNKTRKVIPTTIPKDKISILQALTAFAFPAGIYYAVKNRDSGKDIAIGSSVSAGGLAAHHLLNKQRLTTHPTLSTDPKALLKATLPLAGSLAAGTYMANELGEVRKAKKQTNNKLLNKYPILNTVPYLENL